MASSKVNQPAGPLLFKYKGMLFPPVTSKETLDAMETFEMRDGDVVIVSYSKTGSNWVHQIVHGITTGNTTPEMSRLEFGFPGIQPFHLQLRESPSPRLMGTHLPVHMAPPGMADPQAKVKLIVVMRNPKDVCVSYYHFMHTYMELRTPESWEQYVKDFSVGNVPFGDYIDHLLGWWQKKDDPHFLFVKYEDMHKDFPSSVKRIAAFLERDLTDEDLDRLITSCSIESMRKTLAESEIPVRRSIVRKGVVGDWKNHFSAEESEKFDQKYRERMAGSGLEFDFE